MSLIASQPVNLAGLTPTFAAANNADTVKADGRTLLWVVNGSGSPITVTAVTTQQVAGFDLNDLTVTVGAGAQKLIGPFPKSVFGDANGEVGIDYSSTTTITRAAITY